MQTELDAGKKRIETMQSQATQTYQEREARGAQFEKACQRLREVWKPRLEAFASKFGDKVKVTPSVSPSMREAAMEFTTGICAVKLTLSASPDLERGMLVLHSDLVILPILMDYDRHSKHEQPLDKIDEAKVKAWIDDRLISFVKTYNAIFENEHYLKGTMVEDPIAKMRFPKHAAAGSVTEGAKTVYFVSPETQREYEKRSAAKAKA
jgi:hypothetical protein